MQGLESSFLLPSGRKNMGKKQQQNLQGLGSGQTHETQENFLAKSFIKNLGLSRRLVRSAVRTCLPAHLFSPGFLQRKKAGSEPASPHSFL